jgi:hypothetical protein
VRLLQPRTKLIVEIVRRSNSDEVAPPSRSVIDRPHDSRALHPPTEREGGDEVILTGRESGKPYARNANEARFLRDDLDVAEAAQHADESSSDGEYRRIGTTKERLEREAAARVPQVLRHQTGAALLAHRHRPWPLGHAESLLLQELPRRQHARLITPN